MLTILTLALVAVIVVLGRHLFSPQQKMQPLKIKIEKPIERKTQRRK